MSVLNSFTCFILICCDNITTILRNKTSIFDESISGVALTSVRSVAFRDWMVSGLNEL